MRTVIFFFLVLFYYNSCSAQISGISGSFIHGESITISGASFGVKSPAPPTRFEDFESSGSLRVGGATWDDWDYSDTDDMTLQSVIANRGQSAQIDQGADNEPTFVPVIGMVKTVPAVDQRFYSFQKSYYDWSRTWVGDSCNHKIIRVWSDNGTGSQPDFVGNYPINNITVEGATACTQNVNGVYPAMAENEDVWFTFEYFLGQNSAVDQCDGIVMIYQNEAELINRSNYAFNDTDTPGLLETFGLEWSQDGTSPSGTVYTYVDDVYIDLNSFAHVIIGDASTLATSAHREIQIPSAWADDSVTITVNQGSFADQDTAYLFVVDAAGAVSDGYPVTIGAQQANSHHSGSGTGTMR